MLPHLRSLIPEGIPFPATRSYNAFARSCAVRSFHRAVAQEVASEIGGGRILDVGTGPGYPPMEISKLISDAEVVGVDISEDMVRLAERNAEEADLPRRPKFLVMDASSMSFEDSTFDLVVSTGSLHHWRDPAGVIGEIHRVLRSGGRTWIFELRRDAPRDLVDRRLGDAGTAC